MDQTWGDPEEAGKGAMWNNKAQVNEPRCQNKGSSHLYAAMLI